MAYLQKMSFGDDAPGVSFLMGISPRSGVPYSALERKEIAALWLEIRDLFMKIDAGRNKGSRLTGIKVSIGSQDHNRKLFRRDLGDAVCFSGGTHVGGNVEVCSEAEADGDVLDTWGRLRTFSRRSPHRTTEYDESGTIAADATST